MEVGILNTLLSEITLFHIFVLLVFPYSVFYLFDRSLPNGFDKFSHWEGGLFMFSVGSIIYTLSIWISPLIKIYWFAIYLILFTFFIFYLKKHRNMIISKTALSITKHMYRIKVPVNLKLKNGNKYAGALRYIDSEKIVISKPSNSNILLKKEKNKSVELSGVNEMYFKLDDIDYYYF